MIKLMGEFMIKFKGGLHDQIQGRTLREKRREKRQERRKKREERRKKRDERREKRELTELVM